MLGRYNWGNALLAQGKFDEAINHYSEALQIKPDYAQAHNNMGIALTNKGKIEEAITRFREALRIEPNYAEVRVLEKFFASVNSAGQNLREVIDECEDDLQTVDEMFVVFVKDYEYDSNGVIVDITVRCKKTSPIRIVHVGNFPKIFIESVFSICVLIINF